MASPTALVVVDAQRGLLDGETAVPDAIDVIHHIAYPYVIQHDAQLAARDPATPIQLYLSAGELEEDQFPFFHQLVAFFEQGNYPGLTLTTEIYPAERHGSEGVALTYLHGLRMLYPQAGSEHRD